MPWLRVWALPVLPVSWSLEHWMELSPSWVDEESWLRSPLSPSCSSSWVTWAMAGMAATASIAKSAANNISFFNFTPPYERAFNDIVYSFIHILYCQYLKYSFFLLFLKKLNILGSEGEAEISHRISLEPPHVVTSIRSGHEPPEGIGAAEDRRSPKRRRARAHGPASSLAVPPALYRRPVNPPGVRLLDDLADKEAAAGHQQGAGAEREQRGSATSASLRQLLLLFLLSLGLLLLRLGRRSGRGLGRRSRGSLRRRSRGSLRRRSRGRRGSRSGLAGGRRGLVDFLHALGRIAGAARDAGAALLELEVVRLGVGRDHVRHTLAVAALADTLNGRTLVSVTAATGNLKRLVNLAALAFLLVLLLDLRQSGRGSERHHR